MDGEGDFGEQSAPQSEIVNKIVLVVARTVGFVVAIVAVIVCIALLMAVRAFIALGITKIGVIGLSTLFALIVWCVVKFGNIPPKSIWTIFSRGCM